jgi:hypothetical protein
MKTLSELLTELRQLDELLGIYTNPNAFEPRGGHVETPRERELRLKFERSPRGQSIIAAAQRRDAAGLKKLERLKKLGIAKPTRTPFPWDKDRAGWWHAANQWFTFFHDSDGYHTTQIVNKPQRFGISNSEMEQALDEYLKNKSHFDTEYFESKFDLEDGEKLEPHHIKELIQNEVIDLCFPLQRRVYDKGWFKVYGRRHSDAWISLEGTSKLAARLAVREILATIPGEVKIQLYLYAPNSARQSRTTKTLATRIAAENYIIT